VSAVIEQGKLQERAVGKGPPFLLDVRNGYEWDTGRFEVRAADAANVVRVCWLCSDMECLARRAQSAP